MCGKMRLAEEPTFPPRGCVKISKHGGSPFRVHVLSQKQCTRENFHYFLPTRRRDIIGREKCDQNNGDRCYHYEKRDDSFSPTTFFVTYATLNVVGATKNATAFTIRPTLPESTLRSEQGREIRVPVVDLKSTAVSPSDGRSCCRIALPAAAGLYNWDIELPLAAPDAPPFVGIAGGPRPIQ